MATEHFAKTTQDILDRGIECANDFVSLTISGEHLRRVAELDAYPNEVDCPALDNYDAFLKTYKGDVPDHLPQCLAEVMLELFAFTRLSHIQRNHHQFEQGTRLLDETDEILCTAAAMVRAGRESIEWLKGLSDRVSACVHHLVPELQALCQYAEDHTLIYALDMEWYEQGLHDVYSFWEHLAEFSPSRVALTVAVNQQARRERLIEQAIKNYEEKGPNE